MRPMKDSGVEWIGEIPENWSVIKLKSIYCNSCAGEVIDKGFWHKGNELLYTCQRVPMQSDYIGFPDSKRAGISDLLLTRNATPYIFIPECKAIYSNVVQRITLFSDYNRRFVRYALQCGVDALIVQGDTIPSYNMKVWDNIYIPSLSFGSQSTIVDYLDKKCAKIDALIAKQQEIIEKLKAYKLSVITEAVTKGLNPNVPMKDSGYSFIGDIPKAWLPTKLKHITLAIGDGIHATPDYDEGGEYFFLNGNSIGQDQLVFKENTDKLNEVEFRKYKSPLLTDDTILITLNGATYGKTSFYHGEKVLLGKSAGYITLKSGVSRQYVRYYLQSRVAKIIMELSLCGSTIANLSLGTLNDFFIPLPNIEEQKEITDYLNQECHHLDSIIGNREQMICKLTEYKKSLIYEVVTGKREVNT